MKRALSFFIALCSMHFVHGQNFSFSPSNTLEITYTTGDFASNTVDIVNLTSGSLTFKWIRILEDFPPEWSYSMCDLGSCFPNVPDSNIMNPTGNGGDAFLTCHMTFNNTPGMAELQLYVFEVGDEANGDTVTFRYTAVVGVDEKADNPGILKTYPNPAVDRVRVKPSAGHIIRDLKVYDMNGKVVYSETQPFTGTGSIDVSEFPGGIYLFRFTDEDGSIFTRNIAIRR